MRLGTADCGVEGLCRDCSERGVAYLADTVPLAISAQYYLMRNHNIIAMLTFKAMQLRNISSKYQ